MASKSGFEKALTELDALRTLLEEVAKTTASQLPPISIISPPTPTSISASSPASAPIVITEIPIIDETEIAHMTLKKAENPAADSSITPVVTTNETIKFLSPSVSVPALETEVVAVPITSLPPLTLASTAGSSSHSHSATAAATAIDNAKDLITDVTRSNSTVDALSTKPSSTTIAAATASSDGLVYLQGKSETPLRPNSSQVLEQSEKLLLKLLKVLHVCSRYQQCTKKPLPSSIDFFGKTLLGLTSIR